MFVSSDVQSVFTIQPIYLDTNKQQFYVHKMQYETHLKVTLWFNMAPSSSPGCEPEADVSSLGQVWCHTIDKTKQGRKHFGSRDLGQRVDGIQRRMELQTCTKVQLPHVSPGSCVLTDEGAVLIERNLCPFAVVYQAVIAVWSPHYCLRGGLAPLKPLLLLTFKRCDSKFRKAKGRYEKIGPEMYLYIPPRVGQGGDVSDPAIWRVLITQNRWFISKSYSVICRHLWKIQVKFFMDLRCNN